MKVKICGVTQPEDAAFAAQVGADEIGLIFSPLSKRKVSLQQAYQIVQSSLQHGAIPVGVFVEESAAEIHAICTHLGIRKIQLHGILSKQAYPLLSPYYEIIYMISPAELHTVPLNLDPQTVLLLDHLEGGQGVPLDWNSLHTPERPWRLAGGLNPDNIVTAIDLLTPCGVDVSSGVEGEIPGRKDKKLVKSFIQAAKQKEAMRA